jgi:hypothetical protein
MSFRISSLEKTLSGVTWISSSETERGPGEIKYLDVELKVIQRAYPSQVGRLLAYETPTGRIVNVEQREILLREGKTIRVTISGDNNKSGGDGAAQAGARLTNQRLIRIEA